MTTLTFDTHKYVKQLTAANVPVEQAEAQADALRGVMDTALAEQARVAREASERAVADLDTKAERAVVRLDTKVDGAVARLDAKVDGAVARLDARIELVRKDIVNVEQRMDAKITLLQWMFGILIAGVASLVLKAYF